MGQAAPDRVGEDGDPRTALRRPSRRAAFVATAGAILLATLVLLVVRPALERGGAGELVLVGAIALAVLLFERWLRTH